MAADSYLQTAFNQLQNALNDLQNQMHDMQRGVTDQKRQLQQEIDRMEQECKLHDVEITQLHDDSQKHALIQQISQLRHHADGKRVDMSRLDSEINTGIQRKTQLYNNLRNLMQQLDTLLSSPDLR